MRVVYSDRTEFIDFVVPTLDDAREAIRAGALNGQELLEEAGLSAAEAEVELAQRSRSDRDADGPDSVHTA